MKISVLLFNNKCLADIYQGIIFLIVTITRFIRTFITSPVNDRIVVIAFRKLGDSVFAIPALKAIKKNSKKEVLIFCFTEARPIFEYSFNQETIISFDKSDFYFNRRAVKSIIRKKLASLSPETIYDFAGSTISASLLFNSSAKKIVGFSESYYKPVYTQYHSLRTIPHLMDMYLEVINEEYPIEDERIKEFSIKVKKDGFILIHPFAGWKAKEWNLRKFIKLGELLKDSYKTVIIAESGKINIELKDEINSLTIELIETKDVTELMGIIEGSSVMISNDSGPLYIANMMGKPTFTIYGPTNPDYSMPFGTMHTYIQKKLRCSPEQYSQYCFTNAGRRNCPSFECMNLLEVNEVFQKVSSFISELGIELKKVDQNTK